jgi:hypothetical protein
MRELKSSAVIARWGGARLKCVIEFVPFITSLPNLRSAVELVHAVDTGGVGLLIDSMHFFRSGAL